MNILGLGLPELVVILFAVGVPVLIVVLVVRHSSKRKKESDTDLFCGVCGAPIHGHPASCPECFSEISWGSPALPPAGNPAPTDPPFVTGQQAVPLHGEWGTAPVVAGWKTSVGFSLLGLFVGFPLFVTISVLIGMLLAMLLGFLLAAVSGNASIVEALVMPLGVSIGSATMIVYAAKFYPSYFAEKPLLKSSKVISFANLMFGNLIFGLIWNSNLTKKTKGISHIVYTVMEGLMVAQFVLGLLVSIIFGVSLGLPGSSAQGSGSMGQQGGSALGSSSVTPIPRPPGANVYTDGDTGASFMVPEGWNEVTLTNAEKEELDAIFQFGDENTGYSFIMYHSYDYWGEMMETEQAGHLRNYYNSSILTDIELADLFGLDPSEIQIVTYGTAKYVEFLYTTPSGTNWLQLGCFANGYFYDFRFAGDTTRYSDFEQLVGSALYAK
jgi:hypothetical protein